MKNRIIQFIVLILYFLIPVVSLSQEVDEISPKQQFCNKAQDQSTFLKMLTKTNNQLAFKNYPGPLNLGMCWWHSRFERSILYLATFWPDRDMPSASEAKTIISDIINNRRVVEIPGYSNIKEFTNAWEILIKNELDGWQLLDGLSFSWFNILGPRNANSKTLKTIIDKIYYKVEVDHQLTYINFPTDLDAHAVLVLNVEQLFNEQNIFYGYLLEFLDSNDKGGRYRKVIYNLRDQAIDFGYGSTVPEIQYVTDLQLIKKAHTAYCKEFIEEN